MNAKPEYGAIIWIKSANSGEWFLCEFEKPITDAPDLLGTARVLAGRNKGIGFHMWESNGQEFEEFVVVEKPKPC